MLNWYYLKKEATIEAYDYFDHHIRTLPKSFKGEIDHTAFGLADNDVDAFRHAYVSGCYAQVYNDHAAYYLGYAWELIGNGYGSNTTNPKEAKNMDLWNNAVGRKYGKKATTKEELAKMLQEALKNRELIISLDDSRKYKGKNYTIDPNKPVIVLEEKKTGRNEQFVDLISGDIFSRELFVEQIQFGNYPGYRLSSINGTLIPISKPDGRTDNNLG